MPKGKTWPIGLPPFHEQLLLCWAYCKGTNKTALSQNILQDKIESSRSGIEVMIATQAEGWEISTEEAKVKILAIMKYDSSAGNVPTEPDGR